MDETAKQTGAGRARSMLKGLYYSPAVRAVAYAPLDGIDRLAGRRGPLTPPRRLQYVGRGADFEAVGAHWRDRLLAQGLKATSDVLDIGCGVGRTAVALTPVLTEGTYEGFDVVPSFIRWCSRRISPRYPNFRFQLADVRNRQYNEAGGSPAADYEFPYPDDSFDLAWAASVFTHIQPDGIERYLSETRRVLRPGGSLLCTFFLVDQTAVGSLASGSGAFTLEHRLRDARGTEYLAADDRVPEYCVGVHERDLERMIEGVGLESASGTEFGWWSGRPVTEGSPYQDTITLRKPG